jgi:hypothetical protein
MATSQTCCHLPGKMLNSATNCADRAQIPLYLVATGLRTFQFLFSLFEEKKKKKKSTFFHCFSTFCNLFFLLFFTVFSCKKVVSKNKKHILEVNSTESKKVKKILTIGPGLRTQKSSKTIFLNNVYFFVVGRAKSKVAKVNPSH